MSYSKVDFGEKQTQWAGGAGKGDHERPINRVVYRENMSKIKMHGVHGKISSTKLGKTTYKYT
jgi:hypothetical protein